MKEGLEIIMASWKNPYVMINSCHEFYGACRHKTRFYRYTNTTQKGPDESQTGSKGAEKQKNLKKLTEESNRQRKQETPPKIFVQIFLWGVIYLNFPPCPPMVTVQILKTILEV